MQVRKAYKFALKTNSQLESKLRRIAGSCRFVWNQALALQKRASEEGQQPIFYVEMASFLTHWKKDPFPWLYETPAQSLQQVLRDLDAAWKKCVKEGAGVPRFKKRGQHDSFRYPEPKQFTVDNANGRVKLPKLGWIRFRKSRDVEGKPKQITVSRRGNRWYVSIQVELEIPDPVHPSGTMMGIDMGVKRFATLSDGTYFKPLNSFRKLEKKLAREQRKLSRKVRFSSNWRKQKERISQLHIKIADARNDYLHKASTAIAKSHGMVVLEDLRVSNMSASASGSVEEPGKNVRAKSGLNKAILDQGWFEFRRQLEYKQKWRGGKVVTIPPHNTSRTCPICGHISAENRKTQARFSCEKCHHTANADHVAAINILAAGQAVAACGESALAAC